MKLFYSILISLLSVTGYSQTILHQTESTTRTVQDPQTVIMAPGFRATSGVSNPFIAKIGLGTENPGGGPTDSQAGANNPSGTLSPQGVSFHDTKGEIDVTQSGQLQFTLPIALPPGVKSVAPQINLVYTSGSSNGIAGYGWNVSGITSISRIGKTLEIDGFTKGIQLDYSDYFTFNGKRLILKSGQYGRDGAEYVTEKYSNVKIKSVGTISGQTWQGPEFWEVTFEDGSQAWYGGFTGSGANARTALEYNLVKWKDINGNYITYNYNYSDNISTIVNIEWGGNETLGKPHFNNIQFNYSNTRNFKERNFLKGVEFIQSRILNDITVNSNGSLFKRYAIEYVNNGTSYQFAKKIIEYNSENIAANPIIFNYDQNQITEHIPQMFNTTNGTKHYADFNIDGETDYIEFVSNGTLKYRSSVYKNVPEVTLTYDASKFSSTDFNKATPITIKKDNFIKNNIGLLIPVVKPASQSNMFNVELQIYSVDLSSQQLVFEYSKTLQHDQYFLGDDSNMIPGWYCNYNYFSVVANVYDYNGDGVSEVILNLNRTLSCTDPSIFQPTDPNPIEPQPGGGLPQQPTNPSDYISTTQFYTTLFFDLDQQIPTNQSTLVLDEGSGSGGILVTKDTRLFADLNGDGLQDIIQLKPSTGNISNVYNIIKSTDGSYWQSSVNSFMGQSLTNLYNHGLFGDFNGDQKADFLVPVSNNSNVKRLYISTGTGFEISTINLGVFQTNPTVYFNDSHSGFLGNSCDRVKLGYFRQDVNDIDGDGKSEFILTEVQYEEHEWNNHNDQENTLTQVSVYSLNKIDDYSMVQATDSSGKYTFYKTRVWTNSYPQKAIAFNPISMNNTHQQLLLVGKPANCPNCSESYVQYYNHPSLTTLSRINSIEQGGSKIDIVYKELNPDVNPNLYKPLKKEEYPYYESSKLPKSFAVAQLRKEIALGQILYQDFRYRGLINHNAGRGFIGYRQTARSSWLAAGYENTKVWSGIEIDPQNDAAPIKEWSIRTVNENKIFPQDISENNVELLSFKSTLYQTDKLINGQIINTSIPLSDKPKVVSATLIKSTKSKDFLTGISVVGNITYGDHYLPTSNTMNVNNGFSVSTSTFEYFNNIAGIGADYYIGRPKSKISTSQVYGDSKSSKEEYTYENNLLKTSKSWNRDNTQYLLETYSYDGFGNLLQKFINSNVDDQSQNIISEYDSKGRFMIKKIDNLGLETNITYNNWGQILTEVDPLGNTLVNTYDKWGKILTSKTNLEGTTTFQYEKDFLSNIIVVQNDPDGNITKEYTNVLGQKIMSSTKAFGQGYFVSQATQYDVLGRKIKESEPFFEGQGVNQWNTIEYDDSIFPAKVTVTSFTGKQSETTISGNITSVKELNGYGRTNTKTTDALGNIISTTDKGGTIQFFYNAAGEQIKAQYAENIVTTKYDLWGRKSEFNDPSNGIYKYEYDGLGKLKKIISPKGIKEYVYNGLGQLIIQKELSSTDSGQATNKNITYSYDNKGRVVAKNGTSNGKLYTSTVAYDPQGRVLSSSEGSNGKYFIQKGITYDDKARVVSYEKQLYSSGTLTKVQIENVYSAWNGELYQIKDKDSGKILWELKEVNAKGQTVKDKLGETEINNLYDNKGFLTSINHSSNVKPSVLQISYSFDAIRNELKSRSTGGDFTINETFDYDDNNRLTNWTNPVTGIKPSFDRNVYDVKGRITQNDLVGNIKFENSAKIYQATGMTLNSAGSQNYNNDLIQSIIYNENNDPIFIDGQKGDVGFLYGLTAMRQRVTYGGNFSSNTEGRFTKFYSEDGSFEVLKDNITGKEKHVLYIGGTPYESNIIFIKNFDENSASYKFLHKDYIGSILAITDEIGNKLEQRHFDAWGNFTHLQIGNGAILTDKNIIDNSSLIIERGYTSHEHFAEVGLIHMNGRLYDPLLRRFLNADENIQDPYNTQNYNKYGYVMNNPLMHNDPSGEFFQFLGLGVLFWKAVIVGTYIGFTSYLVTAAVTNQGVSLAGGLKAIFFGAASGAATFGVGSIFSSTAGAATQFAKNLGDAAVVVKAMAHGVAQGTLSLMQNSSFQQSFFSGALGSLGASAFGAVAGQAANSTVGTIAFGAVAGGVGAELTGGNFWQGALIGGVVAGLNHTMHQMTGPGDDELIKKLTPEQRKQLEQIKSGTQLTTEALQKTGLDKVLDNWIENTALGKKLKVGVVDYLSMGGEIYYDHKLQQYNGIGKNEFTFRFFTKAASGLTSAHFGSLAGAAVGAEYGATVGGLVGTVVGAGIGFYIDNTYWRGIKYFDNFMTRFGGYIQRQAIFNARRGF